MLNLDAHREIYLVFMNTIYPAHSLLEDGFKHVYAIERAALGWTCTDPSHSDLHTYILPAEYEADVIKEFITRHPDFKILKLNVKSHTRITYPKIGVLSCVSTMQYMLGVYWPFVLTPYQLYNRIKNKPPTHIEVIAWHDTRFTPHNGKHQQQPQTRSKCVLSWLKTLRWKKKSLIERR